MNDALLNAGDSADMPSWGANSPPRTYEEDGSSPDRQPQPLAGAYFWLVLFFLVYCGRPEDWVPGLSVVPLAKITGVLALLSFLLSIGTVRWRLPREMVYLLLLVVQLWIAVPLSPVWRGGAFEKMLEFSKVLLIMFVMMAAVTTLTRLRRLIFVQAACVAMIAVVTLAEGFNQPGRLQGAIRGIYSNSNDLALTLVLTLPFCLAFLLRTRGLLRKVVWALAGFVMIYVTMLTESRAGLLALIASGSLCLWDFGIKRKRALLVVLFGGVGLAILFLAGGSIRDRFTAMFEDQLSGDRRSARTSAEQREDLLKKSLAVIAEHPLFGIGPGNFSSISGNWHDQHNSYTQVGSEGGLPGLLLYLLILWRAFANLRETRGLASLKSEEILFAAALRASLAGFLIGSFFASVAYDFFPYFLVGYSTALAAIVRMQKSHQIESPNPAPIRTYVENTTTWTSP